MKVTIKVTEFGIRIERPNRPRRHYPQTRRNIQRLADYIARKEVSLTKPTTRPWCGSMIGWIAEVVVLSPTEKDYWEARQRSLAFGQPFQPPAKLPYLGFVAMPQAKK